MANKKMLSMFIISVSILSCILIVYLKFSYMSKNNSKLGELSKNEYFIQELSEAMNLDNTQELKIVDIDPSSIKVEVKTDGLTSAPQLINKNELIKVLGDDKLNLNSKFDGFPEVMNMLFILLISCIFSYPLSMSQKGVLE